MTNRRYMITGAGGMLGRAVTAELGEAAIPLNRADLDVTDPVAVELALSQLRPAALINCAAWTDVDGAESQPAAAHAMNAHAPELLAKACARHGIHFITISTDYVFHGAGDAPWPEDAPEDAYGPLGVYGRSKLAGEHAVRQTNAKWCIVRTQWLYGAGGKNFVDTIAGLARQRGAAGPPLRVVNDQVGAVTWVRDVAAGLRILLEQRATGVYHLANSGYGSWFEVARTIVEMLALPAPVEPCSSAEFPRPARRPANSRLSLAKYTQLAGQAPPDWHDALRAYLQTASK